MSLEEVDFALTTSSIVSHKGASSDASDKANMGGESMMTQSKISAADFNIRSRFLELNNSEGFVGMEPDGKNQNSGFEEVRVTSLQDVKDLNKNYHAIKISSKLGAKKRIALIDYCQKRGFRILNLGISQREIESLEAMVEAPISDLESEEFLDIEDLEDSLGGE